MFPFKNTFARLPEIFHERIEPTKVSAPELLRVNRTLADELGIHLPSTDAEIAAIFSGNTLPEGAEPLAMAYAGHQFGHFVPQLGDGRAILLGEVTDSRGTQRDIQLKGAGRTRFSRGGDGRSALGPVIREYIVSEAMHTMGVPTTRALAMVRTGDPVYRETPLPGAILTRVGASHIRVGTFEFFAARHNTDAIRTLSEYVIQRHYPHCAEDSNPILVMLTEIMRAQARLVAKWMQLGFIHGVMNTDNTTVSGETIDYGPCAFTDDYQHDKVFSSIDQYSRYAYKNQPVIARWNLENLSACLAPLLAETTEEAVELIKGAIEVYSDTFQHHWRVGFLQKIGLLDQTVSNAVQNNLSKKDHDDAASESEHSAQDVQSQNKRTTETTQPDSLTYTELVQRLLSLMNRHRADFTNTFRFLGDDDANLARFRAQFPDAAETDLDVWISDWRVAISEVHDTSESPGIPASVRNQMNLVNPAYIPRNHRIEEAITAALHGDMGPADTLLELLADPYTERVEFRDFAQPPTPEQVVHQTFCGT